MLKRRLRSVRILKIAWTIDRQNGVTFWTRRSAPTGPETAVQTEESRPNPPRWQNENRWDATEGAVWRTEPSPSALRASTSPAKRGRGENSRNDPRQWRAIGRRSGDAAPIHDMRRRGRISATGPPAAALAMTDNVSGQRETALKRKEPRRPERLIR